MKKVIIDACTLIKFYRFDKKNGLNYLLSFLDLNDYKGYINEYVYNIEIEDNQIKEFCDKSLNIIKFEDFLYNQQNKTLYSSQAINLFDIYGVSDINYKQNDIVLDADNVFTLKVADSNLGDIHTILNAKYLNMDILLTDDYDLKKYYDICNKYFFRFKLEIINSVDLINQAKIHNGMSIDNQIIKNLIRVLKN